MRTLLESTATPFAISEYGPRTAIFAQGDVCDSVMHIEKGRVWLGVTSVDGGQAICGLLDAGAFLGEEALAGRDERPRGATAMIATEVLVIPKANMMGLLRSHPWLMERFVSHLLARNTRLEADLTDQLLCSSEQRLAHTLLSLARGDERQPGRWVLPDLTQEFLAEMVGTTRSRVNAFMNKFKRFGFLEERGGVLNIHPGRLHDTPGQGRPGFDGAFQAIE